MNELDREAFDQIEELRPDTLLYTAAPAVAVNEVLFKCLQELHDWVYRNVEWGCLPLEVARAGANIAIAEKLKGDE